MKEKILTTFFIALVLLVSIFVMAGTVSNSATPAPTGYTLEDIYDLIHSNATTTADSHSLIPSVSTDTISSHSVSQLYADLANLVKRENIATGTTYLGVLGSCGNPDPAYATTTVISASLTPTVSLGDPLGYSLDDIYHLITDNTTTTAGTHASTPASTPLASQHTLTEIYTALTTLMSSVNIRSGVTYLGQAGSSACAEPVLIPTITSVNPASGPIGTPVIITGSNFNGTIAVNFGAVTASSFEVNSDTQISTTVPDVQSPGMINISITNAAGTSINTEADDFEYIVIDPPALTYAVVYDGNEQDSGEPPEDLNSPYEEGEEITVLDNTGGLAREGSYGFSLWNTAADGSGTDYSPSATFEMPAAPVTLYAQYEFAPGDEDDPISWVDTSSVGTEQNDSTVGEWVWEVSGNASVSDYVYTATEDYHDYGQPAVPTYSNYLKATNFGFAVPAGATIDGIEVNIERTRAIGRVYDNEVKIVKAGSIGTTDKSGGALWGGEDFSRTTATFGGADDLWGETWTADDINSGGFGVAFATKMTIVGGGGYAKVDHIQITVYYTTY